MNKKFLFCFLLLFSTAVLLSACKQQAGQSANPINTPTVIPEIVATPTPEPTPQPTPTPYSMTGELIAVGDIMMHSPQITGGYDADTKTYSFDEYFTEVKEILSQGDWITANLETTLAGPDARAGYTGYPEFNSPAELAEALKNAGFNIITTANNHSLDRRETGVIRTLENLHKLGFVTAGTAASPEEAAQITLVRKNEIDMAFLAYTYGTNGIPIPEGKDYLVSLIDENKIIENIQQAKQLGADIVTIALHFGDEYHRQPNHAQQKLAASLINAGADIILGSHPHVVQPYQIVEVETSPGVSRKAIIIYSLGNFVSNMTRKYTDIGLIISIKIKKSFPEGKTEIIGIETFPTWVQQYRADNRRRYRILPIQKLISEANDPLISAKDYPVLQKKLDETNELLNSMSVPVSGEKK